MPALGWCDFADFLSVVAGRVPEGARLVETGTYAGLSARTLAQACRDIGKTVTIDTWDNLHGVGPEHFPGESGYADHQAIIAEYGSLEATARATLADYPEVTQRHDDGIAAASHYADGSLPFVFLDDDHAAEHVAAELDAWWPKIAPGGILAGHDYDWAGVCKAVQLFGTRRGRVVDPVSQRCWSIERPTPAPSWRVADRKCLVAVASNERTIPRKTAESLMRLGWGQRVTTAAQSHGFERIDVTWQSKHVLVSDLRDTVMLDALRGGYSHVLFLDADMTWPPTLLDQILRHHGRGIVSGLYHLKQWPHWPVALKSKVWNGTTKSFDYTYDDGAVNVPDAALRSEELVGMGCTLVPVEICRRLERPWFKYQEGAAGLSTLTEDVYFCQRAQAIGCPIWLDPTIACGHIAAEVVDSPHFDRATYEMQLLSERVREQRAHDAGARS